MVPVHLGDYNSFLEDNDYVFVRVMEDDEGSFPILEYKKDGEPFVIKVLDGIKNRENTRIICNELEVNTYLDNKVSDSHRKYLLMPEDILSDPKTKAMFLVMEKMHGTLFDIPSSFFIKFCNQIVSKIFKCMYVLHKNGVVHADLKEDNIFYKIVDNKLTLKIGDFGTSQFLDATKEQVMCGTYIPEDMIKYNGLMEDYRKIDYWQVAITLYSLFTDKQQEFYKKDIPRDEIDFQHIYDTLDQVKNKTLSKFLLDCLDKLIKPKKKGDENKLKNLFTYIDNKGRCRADVKDRQSGRKRVCKNRGRYFGYCDTHKDLFKEPKK